MTTFEAYWLTRLDGINTFLVLLSVISALAISAAAIWYIMSACRIDEYESQRGRRSSKKLGKRAVLVGIVAMFLVVFIPSTKELVAIYGISYLTQNKDAREIPSAALKVLNEKLQELTDGDK